MMKLLECLKVIDGIDGFPLWQELDQYATFSIPKGRSHAIKI